MKKYQRFYLNYFFFFFGVGGVGGGSGCVCGGGGACGGEVLNFQNILNRRVFVMLLYCVTQRYM